MSIIAYTANLTVNQTGSVSPSAGAGIPVSVSFSTISTFSITKTIQAFNNISFQTISTFTISSTQMFKVAKRFIGRFAKFLRINGEF